MYRQTWTIPLNAWFMIHSRLCHYTQHHAKTHVQDASTIMFCRFTCYFSGAQGILGISFGLLLPSDVIKDGVENGPLQSRWFSHQNPKLSSGIFMDFPAMFENHQRATYCNMIHGYFAASTRPPRWVGRGLVTVLESGVASPLGAPGEVGVRHGPGEGLKMRMYHIVLWLVVVNSW